MSSLWTPSGEHSPEGGDDARTPAAPADPAEEAALAEEMRRVRAELIATPVADIVANHALGLWQLAVLHLTPEDSDTPNLPEAEVAIDAMGALVENLGDRLGQNTEPLRDALAQLRLAYVQLSERVDTPPAD